MPRLLLLFLLGTASLAPLALASGEPTVSVTARTEASPNLKRGTLTVRFRDLSRRRFVVRVRFRVDVENPTRVTVFFHPCKRVKKGYACLVHPMDTASRDLAQGKQDMSFRAVVTRGGREIKRPCVGFNVAEQTPEGDRGYNVGPKDGSPLCPQRRR